MKTVCYRGFMGGARSMGKVGYYLVSHLLQRPGYQVYFYPFTNDYMAGFWPQEIERTIIRQTEGLAIDQTISFCSVFDAGAEHFARLTTPWIFYELSTIPAEYVTAINSNDSVYVTSSFVQQTFLDQGVSVPTTVMGHGFDPNFYRFFDRHNHNGEFVFLCVAENTPRKNLPSLIRCFEKAFEGRSGVRLIIKLALHSRGDLQSQITQLQKVTLLVEEFADDAGLVDLYAAAHCFVLPTRAEAFGMPVLEAMATGLPVIVTNYSGQLDFCNEANSFLIRNRGLVDSDPDCFPYVQSQWADPDEDHLIHLMRDVYENYDHALATGRKAFQMAADGWTWEKQLARVLP